MNPLADGFSTKRTVSALASYACPPSGVDVSSSALRFLTARLREHRRVLGTRWRRLSTGREAVFTLAHLRNGQPYAQLAAGFAIGATTVYRYVTETVGLLATLAPTLAKAMRAASMKTYLILVGTLLAIATLKSWRILRRAPLLDDPNHQPRPSRPHPPSGRLKPRMEEAQCFGNCSVTSTCWPSCPVCRPTTRSPLP